MAGLLFVAPAVLLVIVFFLVPLGMAFWMSLHNWPLLGRPRFIGLANYVNLMGDQRFWNAMRFTGYYTVVVTIAIFAVAFPLALFAERARPMIKVYRTAIFLPVVVGFGSASLLWAWLMNVDVGLFSPLALKLGLTDRPVNLLASFDSTFWSIIVMVVWKTAGFNMIILLTGLQSIPPNLYEAASIDGATARQSFWRITVPLLKPSLFLCFVVGIINSFNAFDLIFVMTGGGPGHATDLLVTYIYSTAFKLGHFDYAAAITVANFVLFVGLAFIANRLAGGEAGAVKRSA